MYALLSRLGVVLALCSPTLAQEIATAVEYGGAGSNLLLLSRPDRVLVADLDAAFSPAAISDLLASDLDQDGRTDLAVAWFASDLADPSRNLRQLTLLFGDGLGGFERIDFDLYIPGGLGAPATFQNGTSSLARGDFDGDGDPDLAVLPFWGDEIWFLENTGARAFVPIAKYMFGSVWTSFTLTPPEAAAADFNGDGRDDLVYLADPNQRHLGLIAHFWSTTSTISAMQRMPWEATATVPLPWVRGMALGDIDADRIPDIVVVGSSNANEQTPAMVIWRQFDAVAGRFSEDALTPQLLPVDVDFLTAPERCRPALIVTDQNGGNVEVYRRQCGAEFELERTQTLSGYSASGLGLGMAVCVGKLNGDSEPDFVTRQKYGTIDSEQRVEVTLGLGEGPSWQRLDPGPLDGSGFADPLGMGPLRPRNLFAADLFGTRRSEIICGFGPTPTSKGTRILELAIWRNGCLADINADGGVGVDDLARVLGSLACSGQSGYDAVADLNRDGCVDLTDIAVVLNEFGCSRL
jgi:FG-GAP-like repeat